MNDLLEIALVLAPFLLVALAAITVSDINKRTKYYQRVANERRE